MELKKGLTIAFLGTDGSGKTTIIDRATPELAKFSRIYYEHLRPNMLPNMRRLTWKRNAGNAPETHPHEQKQSGLLASLFRFTYYYFDYTLGYWLKIFPRKTFDRCIWIFDRYYYEYLIDPRRTRVSLPTWFLKLGLKFIPEPELIICLGADPETIHARKPEIPLEEVRRQINELWDFSKKNKHAVWIDTACNVEESVNETLRVIGERLKTGSCAR
ncbi:MAG TPA: hypothetical protein VK152_10670 [Paludibacter sp.]|nr:hypothetical protein [Paludibacter sp.]